MTDFERIPAAARDLELKPPNKALVVSAHGISFLVCCFVDEAIQEMIEAVVGNAEQFALSCAGADYPKLADGIWVLSVRLVDDGPGDWTGSREHIVQFHNACAATKEEWAAYCRDEWPWAPEPAAPAGSEDELEKKT